MQRPCGEHSSPHAPLPPGHPAGGTEKSDERKECAKCGVVTTRLDLHLKRIHGMVKGQELVEGIAAGISRRADTPAMVALSNCLSDYK